MFYLSFTQRPNVSELGLYFLPLLLKNISFPFNCSSICMSRRIKSEGKQWSWTERIILKLQESLEPTASITLSTEWGTLLLTTPQVSDRFACTRIYSVCQPLLPCSAATAHRGLLSKWMLSLVFCLHTHIHICMYTQSPPGVWKYKQRPASSLQKRKKQWTKAQQLGTLAPHQNV